MMITVPLYVHSQDGLFKVRPLFFPRPLAQAEKLERALHRLTRDLREQLHFLGKELRHDQLARYAFNPELDYHRLDVEIELRRRRTRSRFLFVMFEALDRRVAFTPTLPDLWFEVVRGQALGRRANEVLSEHFRKREREDEDRFIKPEDLALVGSAWIHAHEVEISPAPVLATAEETSRMSLGAKEVVDGERELFRVGRCLDQLYPDDLERALLRDREADELSRLINSSDRRPVLLLGPPLVGKTALVHEVVYRAVQGRKDKHKIQEFTFLLSPARLISGMSFVGQWENRLLAILKEAHKRDHVLFFDDFLGLYHAGVTSQSDLSVAHVLKPYVERREVRLVAEMTPETFRVLRERDRGFADLFHVLPFQEPSDADTLRILIAAQRQLEGQHRCRFAVDILPTVVDLERRYARHQAFPGKAVQSLRRLAVKHQGAGVARDAVVHEFHLRSGLATTFLDTRAKLERTEIMEPLRAGIVGQEPALAAAADVISIAKARLNDPDRPLGTFLFLGPTGVGKTQCAKTIARFLFGDADKLVRFDMNEFVAPGSAARLVGTFFQPEGLLTSAVRRRPFAVVLLDEIEKAHPEVFDLLLQVLGEGRLTDAHGRLADFTNSIIILTSNLGVRESQSNLGLRRDDSVDPSVFVHAAERFFRPEFFNRLDRIVPFGRLSRKDIAKIAQGLIQDVLQREGLVRRKCLLQVEDQALERIVEMGFDPRFGARALKRAIERHLTQAVSARVAAGLGESFTHIHVYPAGQDIAVHVEGLAQVEPNPPLPDLDDEPRVLEKLKAVADRVMNQFEPLRPHGDIAADAGKHYAFFAIQEAVRKLRRWVRERKETLEDERRGARSFIQSPNRFGKGHLGKVAGWNEMLRHSHILREMAAAQDIGEYLKELAQQASVWPKDFQDKDSNDDPPDSLLDLVRYAAYLHTLADCVSDGAAEQAIFHLSTANSSASSDFTCCAGQLFSESVGLDFTPLTGRESPGEHVFLVKGLTAVPLARLEEGTHLYCPEHGGVELFQVFIWPVPFHQEPMQVLDARRKEWRDWQRSLEKGSATVDQNPFRLLPVVRIHQENGKLVDLRSGAVYSTPSPHWLLAALPLPPELQSETAVPAST